MPKLKEHNAECLASGIDFKTCDLTNRWMDAPAKLFPGRKHRKFRHTLKDCKTFASQGKDRRERVSRDKACKIHRKTDGLVTD